MPKVTVIIPNYNHARFLEKRILSVLNQTYQDFEVIYLDDASPDNSNQVFAKFAYDKRIHAIYNQVNSGSTFKQWNKGMREAKGEYVWIAESDDYADERLLAELVARLDEHPMVGIAYCQSWNVDKNDNILSSLEEWTADLDQQRWKKDFINSGRDECSRYLIFKTTIPNASAVLIRRSVYKKVGGANENMRVAGDWMLWVKMLLTSDIAFVAEPLNYHRSHAGTVRENNTRNGLLLEESCRMIRYVSENVQIPEDILKVACDRVVNGWVEWIFYFNNYNPSANSRNHTIYKILSDIDSNLNYRFFKNVIRVVRRKLKRVPQKIGKWKVQNVVPTHSHQS